LSPVPGTKPKRTPTQRAELAALGAAIRRARETSGQSQEALALAIEMNRSYVGDVERGARNISYLNLLKIARGAGVELQAIIGDATRE
jgi:transcriptional regulator with XRE-family HTH domain